MNENKLKENAQAPFNYVGLHAKSFTFTELRSQWLLMGFMEDDTVPFSGGEDVWCGLTKHQVVLANLSLMKCLEYDVPWESLLNSDANVMRDLVLAIIDSVTMKLIEAHESTIVYSTLSQYSLARSRFITSLLLDPIDRSPRRGYVHRLSFLQYTEALRFSALIGDRTHKIPCVNRTIRSMMCSDEPKLFVYSFHEARSSIGALTNHFDGHKRVFGIKFGDNDNANHVSHTTILELENLFKFVTSNILHNQFCPNFSPLFRLCSPPYLFGNVYCGSLTNTFTNAQSRVQFFMQDHNSLDASDYRCDDVLHDLFKLWEIDTLDSEVWSIAHDFISAVIIIGTTSLRTDYDFSMRIRGKLVHAALLDRVLAHHELSRYGFSKGVANRISGFILRPSNACLRQHLKIVLGVNDDDVGFAFSGSTGCSGLSDREAVFAGCLETNGVFALQSVQSGLRDARFVRDYFNSLSSGSQMMVS